MELLQVKLSEIDLSSRTFVFSFPPRGDLLRESLRRVGLIEPPVITEHEGRFLPVAGEGRLLALRDLGAERAPVLLARGLSPLKAQEQALESNLFRDLNPVEKAEALARFSRYLSPEEAASKVLPRLGFSAEARWYFLLLRLSEAPRELKEAVAQRGLPLKVAERLLRFPPEALVRTLGLLERLRFTVSEAREVTEGLLDLSRKEDRPLTELLEEFEAFSSRDAFLKAFRGRLRPHLFRREEETRRLREALLSQGARLESPPAFERDEHHLIIPFKDRSELSRRLRRLADFLEKESRAAGDRG
ncbi:hypothetical protein FVE67_01820 [Thermosulfurimonas marina]|uniref:ParB-like N-terminal domain-containing protein n=1 Tax=Thermosulfurimonas marina TaxID=2047767 RepID=A0A6H1WR23_9BACT|nr:ParB N-terminal domain-containing protein [Thermosulfurimonas marina]QJA05609.1 hypothetical protein FVE67_01820 [Thermosulfurimonas marina]